MMQFTPASYRLFLLFINTVFEQPFVNWIVKASKLHSLEWSTNKTHMNSFKYINKETQSMKENSGSANCKTVQKSSHDFRTLQL